MADVSKDKNLTLIGRAERVDLPDLKLADVPAKVDTGADSSAIWASEVRETAEGLQCIFFGPGSPFYSGEVMCFPAGTYSLTRVANSFGHRELRYKLKMRVTVKGRSVKASFTLSDRSAKTYPLLLGRRMLTGKFLVDVSSGQPMSHEEKVKARQLKRELKDLHQGEAQ